MPESVQDRCTKSHEYIFLLSKSKAYYYNAESIAESTATRLGQDIEKQVGSERAVGKTNGNMKAKAPRYGGNKYTAIPHTFYRTKSDTLYDYKPMRNKRSVWNVSTARCKEAHFATYPKELIRPCILAGSRRGGIVIDPFFGSGTTGVVALEEGRKSIGIEINADNVKIAQKQTGEIQMKLY